MQKIGYQNINNSAEQHKKDIKSELVSSSEKFKDNLKNLNEIRLRHGAAKRGGNHPAIQDEDLIINDNASKMSFTPPLKKATIGEGRHEPQHSQTNPSIIQKGDLKPIQFLNSATKMTSSPPRV